MRLLTSAEHLFGSNLTGCGPDPRDDAPQVGSPLSRLEVATHDANGAGLIQAGGSCLATPQMWARSLLVLELGEDLVAHVAVGPDVLHVIAVLEGLDDPEHPARPIEVELDLDGGDEGGLG